MRKIWFVNWRIWFGFCFFWFSIPNLAVAINENAIVDCNYEDKCEWEYGSGWKWTAEKNDGLQLNGPAPRGYDQVLMTKFSPKKNHQTLTSPLLQGSTKSACFQFRYYLKVDRTKEQGIVLNSIFNIFQNSNSVMTSGPEIWSISGTDADFWYQAKVNIIRPTQYQLNFKVYGLDGIAALHDFQLKDEPCSDVGGCDFESGTCGWKSINSVGNSAKFKLLKPKDIPKSDSARNVIHHDHTSHSPNGRLMYISSKELSGESVAQLQSPPMTNLEKQCFSFWYLRTGTGLVLSLYQTSPTGPTTRTLMWQNNHTNLELEWIPIQLNIQFPKGTTNLIFVANQATHGSTSSSLAIDDIQLNPFACPAPISCHFQQSLCGWEPDLTNQYMWSLGIGRVLNANKLNFHDSINGNSPVAYTDFTAISETGQSSNSRMTMLSEFIDSPNTDGACLVMYYTIKTFKDGDTFTIDQIDINGNRNQVFKNQDRSTVFMLAIYIPNPKGNVPYRLAISASSAGHPSTYLGIHYFDYWTTVGKICGNHKIIGSPTTVMPTVPTTTPDPRKSLNCDFEEGNSCHWEREPEFKVGSVDQIESDDPTREFMPPADHTTDNTDGKFAYAFAKRDDPIDTWLRAANPFVGKDSCFTFYYYFYALKRSKFLLKNMASGSGAITWFQAYGANEIRWRQARFTIEAANNTKADFLFSASLDYGLIAIDDIEVTEGSCKQISNEIDRCDFETNDSTCIFEPIFEPGQLQWKWYPASSINQTMVDHSTHSNDGHFYGINLFNSTSNAQRNIIIQSKVLPVTMHCIRFSYYLYDLIHEKSNSLFFKVIDAQQTITNDIDQNAWKVYGNTYGMWRNHQKRVQFSKPFRIVMGVNTNNDYKHGAVFIDDVVVDDEFCSELEECNFENGDTCQMESLLPTLDKFPGDKDTLHTQKNFTQLMIPFVIDYIDVMWRVFSPSQSQRYIGWDHTHHTANGKYLLLSGEKINDRAILITDRYTLNDTRRWICLSFALYKPSTGSTLEVYQSESGIDNVATKIWDTRMTTGSNWMVYNLLVPALTTQSIDMSFYIIGTLQSPGTYLAVDDIMVKSHCPNPSNDQPTRFPYTGPTTLPTSTRLPPNQFACHPGSIFTDPIPIEKVCDWNQDCQDGSDELNCGNCQFDLHNLCGYQIIDDQNDNYRFQFSDLAKFGPESGAHDNSQFMVASDESEAFSGTARFRSPVIHQSYAYCLLKFYYQYNTTSKLSNVDTTDTLYLNLYLVDEQRSVPIWQSSFRPFAQNQWIPILVNLRRISHPFQFEFMSVSMLGFRNFHAIDDIRLEMCNPSKPPQDGESCSQEEFTCANKVCIETDLVCDSVDHCGDGSDERQCSLQRLTTFESGLNGWGEKVNQIWKVARSDKSYDLRLAPPFDHTSGYSQGSYLFVGANDYFRHFRKQVQAEIDSPAFVSRYGDCKIRMFVLKNSPNSTLIVSLRNAQTNELTELDRVTTGDWNFIDRNYFIREQNTYLKLVLSAILNTTMDDNLENYIAIDDISLSTGCSIVGTVPTLKPTTPGPSTSTRDPIIVNCKTKVCDSPKEEGHNQTKQICLKVEQFCDFKKDCTNGIDENNCGDCNFDDGTPCQWESFENMVDMKVVIPASESPGNLPKADASRNSSGGYVAFYSDSVRATIQTKIQTPQINGPTARSCKLLFNVTGFDEKVDISVSILRTKDNKQQYKQSQIEKVFSWNKVSVDIGAVDPKFRIRVSHMAHMANNWQKIAYDNFKLVDCNPYDRHHENTSTVEELNCNFEDDMCGWDIDKQRVFQNNWFRTNSPDKEPGIDHTRLQDPTKAKKGMWLTTFALQPMKLDTNLMSNAYPLAPTNQTYCISFWYYFFGSKFANFSLSISPHPVSSAEDGTTLWLRIVPETRNWNQAFVEIPPQSSLFYINFIARLTSYTVVSLDDIQMYKTACPVVSSEYCDFEVNNCDWTLDGLKRVSGYEKYDDHTTNTIRGHFVSDEPQSEQPAKMTKQLSTLPHLNNTIILREFCLNLYYLMDSPVTNGKLLDTSSQLEVNISITNTIFNSQKVTIGEVYNLGQLNQWTLLTLNLKANKNSLATVTATSNEQTVLFIDDIKFLEYGCEIGGKCDFEDGMCGWQNSHKIISSGLIILWLRVQPLQHAILGQSMMYDTTLGTKKGNYLVLPYDMQLKSASILKSPILYRSQNSNQICLSLNYFGSGTSSSLTILSLYLYDLSTSKKQFNQLIGNLNATTGQLRWTRFQQQVDNLPEVFALKFISLPTSQMSGARIRSDIGIDDISIKDGPCSDDRPTTTSTSTSKPPINQKEFDCDFDHSTCNWQFEQQNWNVTNFDKQRNQNAYAPQIDHNIGTFDGNYLLFSGLIGPQKTYKIVSKVRLTTDGQPHCLTIWYYEDGENQFLLSVFVENHGSATRLAGFGSSIETKHWKPIKIDIPKIAGQFQIVYTPSPNAHFSEFALDDIKLVPGLCSHLHDFIYTFTHGYDDLTLEYVSPGVTFENIGKIYKCSADTTDKVPQIDHTTNSVNGSYFLFKNSPSNAPQYKYTTYLAIENIPKESSVVCLRFAYQFTGPVTLLIVIKAANDHVIDRNDHAVWSASYPKSQWTVAEMNTEISYNHRIVFYMEKRYDSDSFIALDDLTILSTECQNPINCNFEDYQYCSYSPYYDNTTTKYNFGLFNAPPTDLSWPGPRYDHTSDGFGGGYLYMTAYRSVGTFTKLVSKVISGPRQIDSNQNYCLTMWTQMSQPNLEMIVYLVRYGDEWTDNNRTVQLAKRMTKHTVWTKLSANLDSSLIHSTGEVQILIEGQIESDSWGLIAIDDIILDKGACPNSVFTCENGTTLSYDKVCNFIKDCKSGLDEINCGNCTFEDDSCGWNSIENKPDHYHKWQLKTAKDLELIDRNSPHFDGDGNKNGHFMIMFGDKQEETSRAELALNSNTPNLFLKMAYKPCTMQFDYSINQTSGSSFVLEVRIGEVVTDLSTLYSVIPEIDYDGGWRKANVHVGLRFSNFILDFNSFLTDTVTGFVALDNFKFANCQVPAPLPKGQNCPDPEHQVMCDQTRICINKDDICDLVNDCGDGWDELGCNQFDPDLPYNNRSAFMKNCDFEDRLLICSITTDEDEGNDRSQSFTWRLNTGTNLNYNRLNRFEPPIDNTRRTKVGKYIVMEPKITPRASNILTVSGGSTPTPMVYASFYTPMLTSIAGHKCRMRFFYYTNGLPSYMATFHLKILVRFANKPTDKSIALLSIGANPDQRWTKAVVDFDSKTEPFQFVFTGTYRNDLSSRFAIDDISYDNTSCLLSSVNRITTTTTTSTESSVTPTNQPTTTQKPGPDHSNHTGLIVAAVLVPLLLVLFGFGVYFGLRTRRRQASRNSEEIKHVITMSAIQKRVEKQYR